MHTFASLRDQTIKERSRLVSREIAMSLTPILDNGYSLINVAFLGILHKPFLAVSFKFKVQLSHTTKV